MSNKNSNNQHIVNIEKTSCQHTKTQASELLGN